MLLSITPILFIKLTQILNKVKTKITTAILTYLLHILENTINRKEHVNVANEKKEMYQLNFEISAESASKFFNTNPKEISNFLFTKRSTIKTGKFINNDVIQ